MQSTNKELKTIKIKNIMLELTIITACLILGVLVTDRKKFID